MPDENAPTINEPRPLLKISTPLSKELEDYLSIGADLQNVMKATYVATQFSDEDLKDDFSVQTLFVYALTAYARPFADNVRSKLIASDVYSGADGAMDLHEYLILQRNKLIAHSVNPFEKTIVGIWLDDNRNPAGVGYLSLRLVAFLPEGFNQLNQLAKIALEYVNKKTAKLETEVLEEIQIWPPERIGRLKPARYTAPHPSQARDNREA